MPLTRKSVRILTLEFIANHPGKTAVEIAQGIGKSPDQVSSMLYLLSKQQKVDRRTPAIPLRGYEYFAID